MLIRDSEFELLRTILMPLPQVTLIEVIYAQVVSAQVDHLRMVPPQITVNALLNDIAVNPAAAVKLTEVLVANFPSRAEEFVFLNEMVERVRQAQTQLAEDPIEELWVQEEPVVNRHELREILRNLTSGVPYGVVYIHGPKGSGRSHSRHLIQHVAREFKIHCTVAGTGRTLEGRKLKVIYEEMASGVGLSGDPVPWSGQPTDPILGGVEAEGASPADIAQIAVDRIGRKLVNQAGSKRWLVLDFSADLYDRDVHHFVSEMCIARAEGQFGNCVLFVLGTAEHAASVSSFAALKEEVLPGPHLDEIAKVAEAAAQRCTKPLARQELIKRVQQLRAEVSEAPQLDQWRRMGLGLKRLRLEMI